METNERGLYAPTSVTEWFEKRSYAHQEFEDVKRPARRKREQALTVSLVLPGRNVADTIGGFIEEGTTLNEPAPPGDQVRGGDAASAEGTAEVAAPKGA